MKPIIKDVKLQKKVVATIEIPQYETVEEIAEALEAKLMISMINRMLVTDATNQERAKHRESAPGKSKMRNLGFNILPTLTFADGKSGMDKLVACAGDAAKLEALLTCEEVQNAVFERSSVQADED